MPTKTHGLDPTVSAFIESRDRNGTQGQDAMAELDYESEYVATAVFAWFVRVFRRVYADQIRFLAASGVTPSQYGLLTVLLQEDGLSFTELKKRMAVQGSSLTGIVDRLELKKLVVRRGDRRDRRQVQVFLTEDGRQLLAHASTIDPDGVLCTALAALKDRERKWLLGILARLGQEMGDETYGDIVTTLYDYKRESIET